jgi:hypothetical protein
MRWGQARPAQPRGALQISPGEDAHGGLGQHASAPPAPAAGAPVPAGQRPDRQPLPPPITPDAPGQLSLRGRHQTLLTPRRTTRLPRATRPAGPLQAGITIPSPAPTPGGARPSRPSGARSSRRSQGRPARRHSQVDMLTVTEGRPRAEVADRLGVADDAEVVVRSRRYPAGRQADGDRRLLHPGRPGPASPPSSALGGPSAAHRAARRGHTDQIKMLRRTLAR